MTDQEQGYYDRLIKYGHLRQCECYHGKCLVIPEKILELLVKRLIKLIEGR